MRILVATGSFKDVYSPSEAAAVIANALDGSKNDITTLPFCDGGEYTYDVLRERFDYEEVTVSGVLNPYGKTVTSHYLLSGDTAHIVSSCILRLYPEEDQYKNPLTLTDYGYGQLIADALSRGCRHLVLYFGGTSTVSCGMGSVQALGAKLYDESGNMLTHPCTGADLAHISHIDVSDSLYPEVTVHVIGDGNSKTDALPGITSLKVGKCFSSEKAEIVSASTLGVKNILRLTGIAPDKDFTGAAGGLLFGLEQIFSNVTYTLGGLYFKDILDVENQISSCDLVITGEGRYDNTADGKAPSVIASLSQKCGKPAYLVCGQIEKNAVRHYAGGIIDCSEEPQFSAQGIEKLITAQEYYDSVSLPRSYEECIEFFRTRTPLLLQKLFSRCGL